MNIFRLENRNSRKGAFISILSFGSVLLAMLLFFPSMATESMQKLANAKLEGIDPVVLQALGISSIPDFTLITNYFGYVLPFVTLAILTIIVQHATGLFIKEEAEGTIEFLLSKPVSRKRLFVEKVAFQLAYILVLLISCFLISLVGYLLVTDLSLMEMITELGIFFGARIFIALIYSSIGIQISTFIKNGKHATGFTLAIVFGTYILGIMSAVIPKLQFLVWLSPLDWIKSEKLMHEGIRMQEWVLGIVVIVIAIQIAWSIYRKKDLLT